ncbi:MAG TPA: MarR family transcriptional regulator [Actinocrinis sp.]|nr:MarR family transcriptional regulator [Actinocrinis sp.]
MEQSTLSATVQDPGQDQPQNQVQDRAQGQAQGKAQDQAEELRAAIGRFVRQVRHEDGLPGGQAAALGHLSRDGALAITDLADRERVRHQSMARTVRLLADQALVEVAADERDRRRVVVGITALGESVLGADRTKRSARIADALIDRLSPAERALLAQMPALLDKLTMYGDMDSAGEEDSE